MHDVVQTPQRDHRHPRMYVAAVAAWRLRHECCVAPDMWHNSPSCPQNCPARCDQHRQVLFTPRDIPITQPKQCTGKLLAKGAGRWERNVLYPLCSARRRCAGDASELCGEVCWKFSCMLCHHDQVEWCVIERRGHCVTLRRRVSTSRLGPKRGGVAVC